MHKIKMLSGEELLDKGVTKNEATLPVLGLKDVTPDGSWLEQKQTQSALEARKHLIEAQRIEKRGVLNHAVWNEKLKVAEVTQHCGSHWQYIGYQKGKTMYLRPEEALYLIEINCLLLTYNGIVVSLQQAYSLLLRGDITPSKYKVYAYLSRLGYKVVPHEIKSSDEQTTKTVDSNETTEQNDSEIASNEINNSHHNHNGNNDLSDKNDEVINEPVVGKTQEMDICVKEGQDEDTNKNELDTTTHGSSSTISEVIKNLVADIESGKNGNGNESQSNLGSTTQEHTKDESSETKQNLDSKTNIYKDPLTKFIEWKLEKLKDRKSKMINNTEVNISFENIPDLTQNRVVTVKVPKEEYLPKNIFLNNLSYVLNLDSMASKTAVTQNTDSRPYSTSDEVNGDHIRRVTNEPQHNVITPPFYQNFRQIAPHRTFPYWRPRPNLSYFQFNLFFQRPFMTNFNIPRFQFYPRTHYAMFPRCFPNPTNLITNSSFDSQNREECLTLKRKRVNPRKTHLEAIKNLAMRLRQLVALGNNQIENVEALQRLIQTYNIRYRTNVRLNDFYEIVENETIVETIELDDDEQTKNKKRRVEENISLRDVHFNKIRQVAANLKKLETEKKASARHRRALSNLIKTYNKCYNADIYISANNEILDRLSITLDSSSDPESVVEEIPKKKSGKKLRNPFNILKRLSEKHNMSALSPTTSRQDCATEDMDTSKTESPNAVLQSSFNKNWLPNPDDFGKAEVLSRENMNIRIIESKKEEYLFEFLKEKHMEYNNWIETKIAFLENTEESNAIFRHEAMKVDNVDIKSIVKSEDCTDIRTVLKKLDIIKSNNSSNNDGNLTVDFDVYNRDVQNFRKTSKPTPHFRIVCLNDSTSVPSGIEIASLHAKYKDEVPLVFAIAGSSSISFIQMTPINSPVYTASNF